MMKKSVGVIDTFIIGNPDKAYSRHPLPSSKSTALVSLATNRRINKTSNTIPRLAFRREDALGKTRVWIKCARIVSSPIG